MMEDYEDDLERLAAAGLCGGRRSSTVSRSRDASASKNYSPLPSRFPSTLEISLGQYWEKLSRELARVLLFPNATAHMGQFLHTGKMHF